MLRLVTLVPNTTRTAGPILRLAGPIAVIRPMHRKAEGPQWRARAFPSLQIT